MTDEKRRLTLIPKIAEKTNTIDDVQKPDTVESLDRLSENLPKLEFPTTGNNDKAVLEFKSAEQIEKDSVRESLNEILSDPEIEEVIIIARLANDEVLLFGTELHDRIKTLGMLELAKKIV